MPAPLPHADWAGVCAELIARNSARDAYLYLQVTRGAEFGRNHAWPEGLQPTLFAYATALDPRRTRRSGTGSGGGDGGGHALGAARHQIHGPAGQYPAQEAGRRCRRLRNHHARKRRTHRRLLDDRARREGRRHSHAAQRPSHSAGHHARCRHRARRPARCALRQQPRDSEPSCAAPTRSGWHLPPAAYCRSRPSTASRSAPANPVRCSSE